MGKIPPSVRAMIPNAGVAMRKPATASPQPRYSVPITKAETSSRKPANPSSVKQIVQTPILFNSGSLQDAKKVFSSLLQVANSVDSPITVTRYFNSVLQSYVSISNFDDSVAFLSHMMMTAGSSFCPNLSTFHVLLSCSLYDTNVENSPLLSVRKVLNLMVQNGFQPTQATADLAVRSLCAADHFDDAITLIKEMYSKKVKPDIFTYNFLIKCLCRNRSLGFINEFIDEMKSSFGLTPNLVTYTIMIDNVCNSKNLREALRLVSMLKDSGFKPDSYVYNTIMKGFCKLGKGGEVLRVYKQMKDEEVEADLVTFNTLIFGLASSGKVKEAIKYFKLMIESGFGPDAVTYTSLMNGMCREGDAIGALALLEEMKSEGCIPTSCTYNTLLLGLSKTRMLEKGVKLYNSMKTDGTELETASYAALVRALCKEGRVAEAYEVFDYAVESKSLTSASAYSTLESSLKWLKKAREQGLVV